uniref:Uncharacterized protein n=1 Tax=Noctiluca scintillans TaxID=2966 RepID=A0A7S1AL65_NOCSC
MHDFMDLALLGLRSVATVAACAGIGAYARWQGVLDKAGQQVLDRFVQSIFLPALIFDKVTPNTNAEDLRALWPMAVMCVFTVAYGLGAGAAIGTFLARFVREQRTVLLYRPVLMVASGFPNSFSVPLVLMLALGDDPVLTKMGCSGKALSDRINLLFLLSYVVWVFTRWSIGYPLMSGAISFKAWRLKVMNPPVISCFVAVAVGMVWAGLRSSFDSMSLGSVSVPLSTAVDYAGRCSVPAILLTLGGRLYEAVEEIGQNGFAGAGLLSENLVYETSRGNDVAVEKLAMHPIVYLTVVLLRLVIGPLFGALVALGFLRDICGVMDPVVLLVCMLQSAGPPMISIAVMAGLEGKGEREVSKILLLTYSLSILSWSLSIAFFLRLLG